MVKSLDQDSKKRKLFIKTTITQFFNVLAFIPAALTSFASIFTADYAEGDEKAALALFIILNIPTAVLILAFILSIIFKRKKPRLAFLITFIPTATYLCYMLLAISKAIFEAKKNGY